LVSAVSVGLNHTRYTIDVRVLCVCVWIRKTIFIRLSTPTSPSLRMPNGVRVERRTLSKGGNYYSARSRITYASQSALARVRVYTWRAVLKTVNGPRTAFSVFGCSDDISKTNNWNRGAQNGDKLVYTSVVFFFFFSDKLPSSPNTIPIRTNHI